MRWPTVQLGAVTKIVSGSTPKSGNPKFWGGLIPWATPTDLSGLATKELSTTGRQITEEGFASCSANMLPARSVLFSSRAPIGLVAINQTALCTNQGFKSFVPDTTRLSPDFLFWWLKGNRPALEHLGRGATFKEVSKAIIETVEIPLPPLAEQKRIAAILDAADALRAKRREALAQLDALLQSTFLTIFGDPVSNPMGWPRKKLGELAREKPNNGIFRKNPDYVQEGKSGLPVVWVVELFRGSSLNTEESRRVIPVGTEVQKYGLKYGDVLFCRSSLKLDGIAFNNVYLGRDDEALFECHVIRISPDLTKVSPIYLNTLLRSPQMRAIAKSKSKTATMTTIDQKGLCSIEILLPSLKLQQVFANQVETVEKLKTSHRAHLAELDALFAALQHRAFRGEL